ncbi:MAG: hypothetical protein ACAH80_12445 [Alphaproteobacteria bacterium]
MAGSYEELSAAFNQSARDFLRMEPDAAWLVTRYTALLKFKATTEEQKADVVKTLCTCFEDYLKKYTKPDLTWISPESEANLQRLSAALKAPETLKRIGDKTAQSLADLSIDLLDQAKRMEDNDSIPYKNRSDYYHKLTRFAGFALSTAEAFQAEITAREVDVKTSKNISPAKRITLKAANEGGPQP